MLEATYHKMMVQTPPDKRLEAVRAVSKLLGESSGLLDLTWLGNISDGDTVEEHHSANDMALIIMY